MNAVSTELEQQMPPQAVIIQMAMGFIVSQALAVSARLEIADLLADDAKTAEGLAVKG